MDTAYHAGRVPDERRFRLLMWVFCFSFVFDYRGEKGGPPVQLLFLGVAAVAGGLAVLTSLRYLSVRPGIYLIVLWWGFLASTVVMAVFGEVEPGRYVRVVSPYMLCGTGLLMAHIAAVRGVRVQDIVFPLAIAAVINVAWRAVFGFAFMGVSMENARVEILSPGLNWLMAYIGCGFLLRSRLSPFLFVVMIVCSFTILLSVTRGTLFPLVVSVIATSFCLLLAVVWRIIPVRWVAGKVFRSSILAVFLAALLGVVLLAEGKILERWESRLFHHAGEVTSRDVSWLSREAEAVGIWKSLMSDPPAIVYGKGMGAGYFWDASYFPEIYEVYTDNNGFNGEIWFAGHSTWTFALFSGGIIGVLCTLGFFGGVMWLSLRSVYCNAAFPGFRVDLAFLPFVAACCFLSESATSNPFDERLAGLLFGVMAGLPQFFFNRAYVLRNPVPRDVGETAAGSPFAPAPRVAENVFPKRGATPDFSRL